MTKVWTWLLPIRGTKHKRSPHDTRGHAASALSLPLARVRAVLGNFIPFLRLKRGLFPSVSIPAVTFGNYDTGFKVTLVITKLGKQYLMETSNITPHRVFFKCVLKTLAPLITRKPHLRQPSRSTTQRRLGWLCPSQPSQLPRSATSGRHRAFNPTVTVSK